MYSLRYATIVDIPLIRELCLQVWPQTYAPLLPQAQIEFMLEWMYSPSVLKEQIERGVVYAFCYDNDQAIGYASWDEHADGICKLEKLYVLSSHQQQGCGNFLLNHIAMAATERGCHCIQLQVNKKNPAKRFYERFGFFIAKEATTDIGQGFVMDDYVMQLTLPRRKN